MWAIVKDGKVEQVFKRPQAFRDKDGKLHPAGLLLKLPAEQLAELGVYPVVNVTEPPSSFHMEKRDSAKYTLTTNRVERSVEYVPLPPEYAKLRAQRSINAWRKWRLEQPLLAAYPLELDASPKARYMILEAAVEALLTGADAELVDEKGNRARFSKEALASMYAELRGRVLHVEDTLAAERALLARAKDSAEVQVQCKRLDDESGFDMTKRLRRR